ncbi:MAG: hypothetical protein ABI435_04515 [Pseudolysinimonas sp.]
MMMVDPAYSAIEGFSNEIRDTQNGCPAGQIALDGAEGVLGLVGTVALAGGLVEGGGAAGLPAALRSVSWADETGAISLAPKARRLLGNLADESEKTVGELIRN